MFEKASRMKVRFNTRKGNLSVEDLWDLNLSELNTLAKSLNKILKEASEEDFLEVSSSVDVENKLKFDLVIHVLTAKKDELEKKESAKKRKEDRDKLLEVLSKKKAANLENMSEEEILKKLEELS